MSEESMSEEEQDEVIYGAEIPLETLGNIIGVSIPEDKDPYDGFDTDEEAAEYGDEKQRVIDALYWVFERFTFAFDWAHFYVLFRRGTYGDEPESEEEYLKWLPQVIINKSGELSEKKEKLIRNLNFKKFTDEKELNQLYDTWDITELALDLSDYYTET